MTARRGRPATEQEIEDAALTAMARDALAEVAAGAPTAPLETVLAERTERQREGWIRRADWSARTEPLGPPNPSLWSNRPFWIPSSKVCPARRLASSFEPDGQPGDLWRCPECGLLWKVIRDPDPHGRTAGDWKLLGFWQQTAYRRGWWQP